MKLLKNFKTEKKWSEKEVNKVIEKLKNTEDFSPCKKRKCD
jgi:hypothetical protein